ncbi:hypothetical protein [Kibdelosporangium philippinense]|uniref:hypothetical protein n=1 Tax=Kibdelosporangium philippinense TaxID=211113 RepID=UPI00361DB7E3
MDPSPPSSGLREIVPEYAARRQTNIRIFGLADRIFGGDMRPIARYVASVTAGR